jgi:hypothetical protein
MSVETLAERGRAMDRVWTGRHPGLRTKPLCVAAGTLCVADLKMPPAPTGDFGGPEVQRYYPSTAQIAAAGNVVAALAMNDVPVPSTICCGAIPGRPAAAA